MKLYKKKSGVLTKIKTVPFKLEKDIQTLVEGNMDEIFGLTFVTSEFKIGEFRIDSLCFDEETQSFIIVEYKKGDSYSVIDQGYSYLSKMIHNKSDFILEYNESMNKTLKRDDINWEESKVIFVSPSFNSYQKNSINFKDVPFELYEIKQYSNDTFSINQHLSSSSESINKISKGRNKIIENVNKEVKVFTESDYLKSLGNHLIEPSNKLKNKILELNDVETRFRHIYMNFWVNGQVIVYLNRGKKYISVDILSGSKNRFKLDDPKKYFTVWKKKSTGQDIYYHHLTDESDLDYVFMMIKQKYESVIKND